MTQRETEIIGEQSAGDLYQSTNTNPADFANTEDSQLEDSQLIGVDLAVGEPTWVAQVVALCPCCEVPVCLPFDQDNLEDWETGPQVVCVQCQGHTDRAACIVGTVSETE